MGRGKQIKKSTSKRELILNTMQEYFAEGKAGTASVSDIAKRAGIAKGGLYYYFKSKEEVMDALVVREYTERIDTCKQKLQEAETANNFDALQKYAFFWKMYKTTYVDPSVDEYLHLPQNAALHQKSLSIVLLSISEIITEIIYQGIKEGIFSCDYPEEYAQISLSFLTFLMDPGIFTWTPLQQLSKLKAFASFMEKGLSAPSGSFSFLMDLS